jgi:hypothetical protein
MTVRLSETLTQYLADLDAYRKVAILFEHATHFVIRKVVMLTMTPLALAAKAEPSINASFIPRNTLHSSFKWQSLTNILQGVDRDVSILSGYTSITPA